MNLCLCSNACSNACSTELYKVYVLVLQMNVEDIHDKRYLIELLSVHRKIDNTAFDLVEKYFFFSLFIFKKLFFHHDLKIRPLFYFKIPSWTRLERTNSLKRMIGMSSEIIMSLFPWNLDLFHIRCDGKLETLEIESSN